MEAGRAGWECVQREIIIACPFWSEAWWLPPVCDACDRACPVLQQRGLALGAATGTNPCSLPGAGGGAGQLEQQQQPCPAVSQLC